MLPSLWASRRSLDSLVSDAKFHWLSILGPERRPGKVYVDTVVCGFMMKDLALLVGPDAKSLSTKGLLDKVDEKSEKADGVIRFCI
jgi:hypothetical protein